MVNLPRRLSQLLMGFGRMEGEDTEIHVSDAVAGVHDTSISNCGVCAVNHQKGNLHRQRFQQTKYLIDHYHFEPGNVIANCAHHKVRWVQSTKMEILIHLRQLAQRGWTGCDGEGGMEANSVLDTPVLRRWDYASHIGTFLCYHKKRIIPCFCLHGCH